VIVAIPAAAVLTLAMFATIRYFGHRLTHALIAFTAGFLIAGTVAAPVIHSVLTGLAGAAANIADHL
jgi:hypothetical protein